MQDKIRKFFKWVWFNKERMVLIVMLGFLMYRVWQVVRPPEAQAEVPLPLPQSPPSPEAMPPQPGVRPPLSVPGEYASLHQRNPFWYYGKTDGGDTRQEEVEIPIDLIMIRTVNGKPRAQLKTATTTQWYYEGDPFEEFQLLEINEEEQTVTIYAERLGRRRTISVNE